MTGDIHIWYRETESLDSSAVRAAEATLSAEERARADRLRFPHDRRDYVVAHDLLRRSLSTLDPLEPGEWQFDVNEHGKPHVRPAVPGDGSNERRALSFSLTHTRGLVACAIGFNVRVGVDVERLDRDVAAAEVAARFFAPREVAALQQCDAASRTLRFVELWTLKEAYVKAIGLGLTQPLSALSFDLEDDAIAFTSPSSDRASWSFAVFAPSPSTRMAVAVCGGNRDQPGLVVRADGGAVTRDGGTRMSPLRTSAG